MYSKGKEQKLKKWRGTKTTENTQKVQAYKEKGEGGEGEGEREGDKGHRVHTGVCKSLIPPPSSQSVTQHINSW